MSINPVRWRAALALAAASGVLATGCQVKQGGASKPAAEFPTRGQLAAIAPAPVAGALFEKAEAPAGAFSFESAAAVEARSYDDKSPWGDLAREMAAQGDGARVSGELLCAARAIAAFHLKSGAAPPAALKRFMAARCGAVATGTTFGSATAPVSPTATDAEIFAEASKPLREGISKQVKGGVRELAIGVARSGDKVAVVVGMARPKIAIEAQAVEPGGEAAIIRGKLLEPSDWVLGYVNQGKYGVAGCQVDPSIELPAFVMRCPFAQADKTSWVEILSHRQGRFLMGTVADVLLHRGDASSLSYEPADYGPAVPVKSAAELSWAIVRRLNEVRGKARLGPLAAAAAQAETNARLAGPMTQALLGNDEQRADLIATGLSAGWDVTGEIRKGDFYVSLVPSTNDAGMWVTDALERPSGRSILLAPDAHQIAIGPILPDKGMGLGAIATTYSLFAGDDHRADVARVYAAIDRARAARGLPPVSRVGTTDEVERQLALVRANKKPVPDAAHDALYAVAGATGGRVEGFSLETIEIDHVPVPPALMGPGSPRVMVGVTHHKVEGAAWGQYVVTMMVISGGGASAEAEQVPGPKGF